jgi:glucose-1-phosphate cytidylyltransferase
MKVVILAGGFGTRLTEETDIKPKPMVEIGEKPILWHIMKIYSTYGFNDFIICLGYKGYLIKEYFINYFNHLSDFTVDLANGQIERHNNKAEPWKVTLVDTGINTMTGGRIKRIKDFVHNEAFMLTYGDGVGDIDLGKLCSFHKQNGKLATITAVQPPGRFGAIHLSKADAVSSFSEKPLGDGAWINGGFFVLEPSIFDYIQGDQTLWEKEPLEQLAQSNNLYAYKHYGFWRPMDTLRDKRDLEELWVKGAAPWKIWE